ncbi:MAG: type II toxin-antitoxin system VapB family antitoxin [Microbacterium sp.]
MATNLAIDPELLERAQRVGGERTKKATVTVALEEHVARRRRTSIVDRFGTSEWDDDYDYKGERSRDSGRRPGERMSSTRHPTGNARCADHAGRDRP